MCAQLSYVNITYRIPIYKYVSCFSLSIDSQSVHITHTQPVILLIIMKKLIMHEHERLRARDDIYR